MTVPSPRPPGRRPRAVDSVQASKGSLIDVSSSEMEAAVDNVLDWRAGFWRAVVLGSLLDIRSGQPASVGFTPEDSQDL
jgi:hypothetical protein